MQKSIFSKWPAIAKINENTHKKFPDARVLEVSVSHWLLLENISSHGICFQIFEISNLLIRISY